jgi:hypothetical protein
MSDMKRTILLSVFLIQTSVLTYSQILKGKITNESGAAIPYATVYIQELKQGTTSNTKGDYELKLPAGKYFVTYQSLGFSPMFFNISISDQTITKDVVLPVQYYQIPEVRITATGEDPAYGIMRKAIGMAPYYLNNVSYYKAEVYLKGNVVINKIPKLLQKAINVEAKNDKGHGISSTKIKEGDAFMMESFNEIEFTAPDKYVQKVISMNNTFPGEDDNISPMDIINASFYQPLIANMAISPLSPKAFSYYKFKYQGATIQGNNTINKIQVIPKIKSQQLFEGTIYLIEDLWCLQSVDLTNDNMAGKINVQQLYIPVQDEIWMPVSHKFKMAVSIIGVRADAGYGSSVRYLDLKPNTALKKPEEVTSVYFSKPVISQTTENLTVSKEQEKIEEILQKDKLNNRDMVKLSKLMEKQSEETLPDSVRNNLEIKDKTTHTIENDAQKKDSAYWAEIRPIPLSDVELQSIRVRDSIIKETNLKSFRTDSVIKGGQKKKSRFISILNDIGFGHTWSDTTGLSFNFGGLLNTDNLSFNTVDGFIYGVNFRLSKEWEPSNSLTIAPELRWAFSREELMWRVNGNYSFDRMKQRQVFFRTGITSRDIVTSGSINTFLNSITTLFMERNYMKLYETHYLNLGYRSEITNGLNLEISAGYELRKVLDNTTDFTFIKTTREYSVNIPENEYLAPGSNPGYALRDQDHFEFVTTITYTPRQRYKIYGAAKINSGSDWPTFSLTWEHGINEFSGLADSYKHFDMFRLEVSKREEIGGFSEFRWRFRTGGFLNNSWLTYYDFFHFNSQPLPVLLDDYQDAFRLPAYYSLSTPEFFGEAHLKYTTPYLFLKYLPGLSKTLMRENISISCLGSGHRSSYTEIGYSISEISLFGELGVFIGFDNLKYRSTGLRLVLKIR